MSSMAGSTFSVTDIALTPRYALRPGGPSQTSHRRRHLRVLHDVEAAAADLLLARAHDHRVRALGREGDADAERQHHALVLSLDRARRPPRLELHLELLAERLAVGVLDLERQHVPLVGLRPRHVEPEGDPEGVIGGK